MYGFWCPSLFLPLPLSQVFSFCWAIGCFVDFLIVLRCTSLSYTFALVCWYIFRTDLFTGNSISLDEPNKCLLGFSIRNDTIFLMRVNVMDYSLLVGIDTERKELIVGIIGDYFVQIFFSVTWISWLYIFFLFFFFFWSALFLLSPTILSSCLDYLRQYTWDKQLETLVKSSGIMGGRGVKPTVVSPKDYKQRFREAMDRYFELIPDKFYGILVPRRPRRWSNLWGNFLF